MLDSSHFACIHVKRVEITNFSSNLILKDLDFFFYLGKLVISCDIKIVIDRRLYVQVSLDICLCTGLSIFSGMRLHVRKSVKK